MVGLEWFGDNPGGAGRYMADAAAGLAALGHQVAVVVPRLLADSPAIEQCGKVEIHRFDQGQGPFKLAAAMQPIHQLLDKRGPFDAVHSHHAYFAAVPLWHPRLARSRHVCQFQGPWAGESVVEGAGRVGRLAKYAIERLAYARCDRFITLSQGFARLLTTDYAISPSKISVIPAAVDLERFCLPIDRAVLRREMGLDAGPIVFVMRRLVRRMGLEILLDAFARVRRELPDARLIVGGSGPLEGALRTQSASLGLQEAVSFTGRLSDVDLVRHYQCADLTVMPTVALEGFGLSTVESLACGTPVVGTTEGGTAEILGPFDQRLLIPPGQVAALATCILEMLAPGNTRPSANACRQYAQAHYAWPRVLAALEAELRRPA
jgi:glycosyltransferase involved in cell wall biosynthesis